MEVAGAQRVLVTLANSLADLDHDVHLINLTGRAPLVDEIVPRVEYHQLDASRALTAVPALRAKLKELKPVSVISVMQGGYTSLMATAGMKDRPVLVAGHHDRPQSLEALGRFDRHHAVAASMAAAYRGVDVTACVCQDSVDELCEMLRMTPDRFAVLPNPVDVNDTMRLSLTGEAHPMLLGPNPSVVVVASHTPKKKLNLAIEAMAHLPEHRLVVLGDGPLRPELEARIGELALDDRVTLAGVWPNPFPSMLAADVVLSTSESEALPLGLIEAVVLGAKIVTTDSGSGTREIVTDYDAGLVVGNDPADPVEIAAAIQAATDLEVRPDQVEAKRKIYDRLAVANDYLDLIERFR